MGAKGKNILLIVNPKAGMLQSQRGLYKIIEAFCKKGSLVSVHLTQARGDARDTAARIGAQFDLVVCAGGDGTLNEVISGLMTLESRPLLGYIPCGSTNDFAYSLHLSRNISAAAKDIASGKPQPIDIGLHNGRPFAYIASFGAFSESSYLADQKAKNTLGHLAYIFEGMRDLKNIRPISLRAEYDGQVREGSFLFGCVANTLSMGGVLRLRSSDVALDDGLFELILVKNPPSVVEFNQIIRCLSKQKFDGEYVTMVKARKVCFTFSDAPDWSLDGEYAPGTNSVSVENLHAALTLVR